MPRTHRIRTSPGGETSPGRSRGQAAVDAKNPVILNGAGVVLSKGGIEASMALAERLDAPVCVGYQHNDAFPGNHPLFAGPLGYNGSKAGMELIKRPMWSWPWHPAEPVLDPAGLRHRLLAQGRQDHPGGHQPRPHRPDQEGDGGHRG